MGTQWLQLQNGRISYEDSGEGPLVVCAPSIGDVRAEYRFLAPQLVQAGYRVIQMDVRGLGESSVNWADYSVAALGSDLLALIHALDAGPAVIVGTSMAAAGAVWAAVEEPENVSGLVLIGPAVRGEVSSPNQMLYRVLFARPWGPSVWVKYYTSLYPTRKPEDFSQYMAVLGRNLREPGRIESALRMMLAPKTASEERLPRVTVPSQVIMGSKDPDFKIPEAEARWVAGQLQSEVHIVEGAGHYPHAELPEVTGPLVIGFLRSNEKTRVGRRVA